MTSKTTWKTSEKGTFVRDASKFRNWIEPDPNADFPAGTLSLCVRVQFVYVHCS